MFGIRGMDQPNNQGNQDSDRTLNEGSSGVRPSALDVNGSPTLNQFLSLSPGQALGSTTLKKNDDGDLEDAGRSSLSREMPLSTKNASDTSDVVAQLNTMKLGDGKKVSTDTDKETSKDKESDNSKNNKNNKSNKNNKNNKNNKGSGDTKNKTTNGPNVDSSLTTPYAKGAQQPGGGQNNALLKPSAIANNGNLENPNPGNNGTNGGNNGNGGTNGNNGNNGNNGGPAQNNQNDAKTAAQAQALQQQIAYAHMQQMQAQVQLQQLQMAGYNVNPAQIGTASSSNFIVLVFFLGHQGQLFGCILVHSTLFLFSFHCRPHSANAAVDAKPRLRPIRQLQHERRRQWDECHAIRWPGAAATGT